MAKPKTLGDYVYEGRHELVAFVRDTKNVDIHDDDSTTQGNRLGISHLGVLVCDRKLGSKEEQAHFFFKDKPRNKTDSDIASVSLSYDYTKVVSEFPLALSSDNFLVGWHCGKDTSVYEEAKRILTEHGLY